MAVATSTVVGAGIAGICAHAAEVNKSEASASGANRVGACPDFMKPPSVEDAARGHFGRANCHSIEGFYQVGSELVNQSEGAGARFQRPSAGAGSAARALRAHTAPRFPGVRSPHESPS